MMVAPKKKKKLNVNKVERRVVAEQLLISLSAGDKVAIVCDKFELETLIEVLEGRPKRSKKKQMEEMADDLRTLKKATFKE